ncbi:helix-turn-helix transcriptional regulator [Achromobacter insuavis]
MSQEELALRAGLDRTYVSSCERGKRNVSLETIVKLAEALAVPPSLLLSSLDGLREDQ